MSKTKLVGVNEKGYRIGEDHPHAKLSDEDVELVRALRDEGLSYGEIVKKFDGDVTLSKSMAWQICTFRKRAQVATSWKRVPAKEKGK